MKFADGSEKVIRGKSSHGSRPENGDNAVTKFVAEYKMKMLSLVGWLNFSHTENATESPAVLVFRRCVRRDDLCADYP